MNTKTFCMTFMVLIFTVLIFVAPTGVWAQSQELDTGFQEERILVELASERVDRLRLEAFDVSGRRIYDTGVKPGRSLELAGLDSQTWEGEPASFELRAWDAEGELVLSQVSSLDGREGGEQIFSVHFDVIPAGLQFGGAPIILGGRVNVQGDLDMSANTILFDNGFGLRTDGGALMQTGLQGGTFQFTAGPIPGMDLVQFRDGAGNQKVVINSLGGLRHLGGQKFCSARVGASPRTILLVSAGWTASTCASFRNNVAGGGIYQLGCLFDDTFSFGSENGGIPPQNCGW